MLKLTYIVPAYNASASIQRTLDSIFSLPLSESEYEVIVVDDCSTDDTLDVLAGMQKTHSNLIVFHQDTNQRQGAARNRGVEKAKGKYIAFCDADDCIVVEGVMNVVKAVENSNADICYFDYEYEHPKGEWHLCKTLPEFHNAILSSHDYLENYYTCYYNASWRSFYRAEFLREANIHFVEGVWWEDCDWTVKIYAKAKRIQFVEGVGYRYAFNEGATSKNRTPKAISERVYAGLRLMEYGKEIKTILPRLSQVLSDEGRCYYVIDTIRLRNLTKYSVKQIRELYSCLGEERRVALSKYSWDTWESLFVNHKRVSLFLLFFFCPLAFVGRKVVRMVRKCC